MEMKNMAYWKAKADGTDIKQGAPTKFLMKAAGMLIGANKRRQASKDAADQAKAQGVQNAMSGGIAK